MITSIRTEEAHRDDHEKILLYLGIRIDRGYECIFWIERHHLLIFTDRMRDIGSLHLSFSWSIRWMYYIHDLDSLSIVFTDDAFCMTRSIGSTSLGSEEHYDIFLIGVVGGLYREDILLDHIVWFCIYRNDDDMLDILGSFFDDFIFGPVISLHF